MRGRREDDNDDDDDDDDDDDVRGLLCSNLLNGGNRFII
jgi:hypothetical protein